MKKSLIIYLLMLLVFQTIGQDLTPCSSCFPDGIFFNTQASIDNFATTYPTCTTIIGTVRIGGPDITNVAGLSILTSIISELIIYNNALLTNLNGLNNLSSIGGDLTIINNATLSSLTGLGGLTDIGGNLAVINNNSLTSLTGLGNINAGSIYDLYIYDNQSLSTCNVQSVCNYLSSPNGRVDVYGNATGCSNPTELASDCGISLSCLPHGDYNFLNQTDVDYFPVWFPNCTDIKGNVAIRGGGNISNLSGLSSIKTIEGSLYIVNQTGLQDLAGLEGLNAIGHDLHIRDNTSLTSLNGLDSLSNIGGYLLLEINPSLTSMDGLSALKSLGDELLLRENQALLTLSGLDSLHSIGGSLSIYDNLTLASLDALKNVKGIGASMEIIGNISLTTLSGLDSINAISIEFLSVYDNNSLSDCHVQSVCDYLASHNYGFNIYNNALGCNNDNEIEAACTTIGIDDENLISQFIVYPNPSKDIITINKETRCIVAMFDMHGKQILSFENSTSPLTIDVSKFAAGVYFLRLINENGVQFAKLVKE